ncbi:MAG: MBL fold metallo-hydrolase [Desulfovibrionaceae bacterium]
MKLKIAGCSGTSVRETFLTTFCVNDVVLLDAGAATSGLTLPEQARITDVFLSHPHLDHVGDLLFLADNLVELICQDHCDTVMINGTAPVLDAVRTHLLNNTVWPDFTAIPPQCPVLRLEPMAFGEARTVQGLAVTALPVNHGPGACGFVLREMETGASLAYTGDTGVCAAWWEALDALETPIENVIVECSFPNSLEGLAHASRHLTPALLAAEVARLSHRPRLFISHMKHTFAGRIIKELQAALEGWDLHFLRQGGVLHL